MHDAIRETKWPATSVENTTIEYAKNVASKQNCLSYFKQTRSSYANDGLYANNDFNILSGILNILRLLLIILFNNMITLFLLTLTLTLLFWMYKSFWRPLNIVKELTEVGFDHIPRGKNRDQRVKRARVARKLGDNIPPPYPDGWFAVLESYELATGEVKSVDVLGENLAVLRGEDGVVHIVDAYCPHLGANMGVGGRVTGSCIECPFHKWRFDAETGECVNVSGQGTAIRGIRVRTWYSVEVDKIIWIWYSSENAPPKWRVASASDLTSRWRFCGKNDIIVNSHIQDIPENGADVAHLNAIHSVSMFTSIETGEKMAWLQNIIGRHTWDAKWSRGEGHTAHIDIKHEYKLMKKVSLLKMDIKAVQMGPGLVHLCTSNMLIIQTVTPVAPLEQRVIHRIYSTTLMAPFASIFLIGETIMFERDVKMWNNKRYVANPAYSKEDKTIKTFRSWYSQFYTESSISFKDALSRQNKLDW